MSLDIDTKGICLLCLKAEKFPLGEGDRPHTRTELKKILEYLQVDMTKLQIPSIILLYLGDDVRQVKMTVLVCENCSSLTTAVHDLLRQWEELKLKLENCVHQVHNLKENGGQNTDRIEEYKRRMVTGESGDESGRIYLRIADNLRKQFFEKVAERVKLAGANLNLENSVDGTCHEEIPGTCPFLRQNSPPPVIDLEKEDDDEEPSVEKNSNDEITEDCSLPEVAPPPLKPGKRCPHCGKQFSKPYFLERHQLVAHTLILLKERMHIPSSVTQEHLNGAVRRISSKCQEILKSKGNVQLKCIWCKKDEWNLKLHLLQHHLDKVLTEISWPPVPSSPQPHSSQSQPQSSQPMQFVADSNFDLKSHSEGPHATLRQKYLKCKYCQHRFASEQHLHIHQIQKHPISFYSERFTFPRGMSNRIFRDVVKEIADKSKTVPPRNAREKLTSQRVRVCPHCTVRLEEGIRGVRLHIADLHVPQVIEVATIKLRPERSQVWVAGSIEVDP